MKTTNVVGVARINEAWGLLTIDLLVKIAMKEGILDIELVDRPRPRDGDAENKADRSWLDDGAERLVKVNARQLREATDDPPCLVASKAAIRVELVFENPLA
jgi:hypothetical protein